jgi:hypothetical protein
MKVKAIKTGYYGGIMRRVGVEFLLSSGADFSSNWMTKTEVEAKSQIEPAIKKSKKSK